MSTILSFFSAKGLRAIARLILLLVLLSGQHAAATALPAAPADLPPLSAAVIREEALDWYLNPQSPWYDWNEELGLLLPALFARMQAAQGCIAYLKK